jgi:uncharacterized iron-regulated membrane protein
MVVDPDTGAVTERLNFTDWPVMAKLADWIVGAHMGILFGVLNQVVLVAAAVAMIVGVLLGYRMWWRRRPAGNLRMPSGPRAARAGAGPSVLAALRPHEAALVLVALVGFGYFAPLFGLSLVAFIAADLAIGWWRAR